MLLPDDMNELYITRRERIEGHATYSNFRRFEVETQNQVRRGRSQRTEISSTGIYTEERRNGDTWLSIPKRLRFSVLRLRV